MRVRELAPCELYKLEAGAREFYSASKFLGSFNPDRFKALWSEFINRGIGVILVLEDDSDIRGALGGMIHREPYGENQVAEEFFWFVRPDFRGEGIKLYLKFEKWAKDKGASMLHMVHILDVMPEKLEQFYRMMGYQAAEVRYIKSL